MKCTKCDQYSFALRRCKNGKINPKTRKGTVEAMVIMGLGYICNHCSWKRVAAEIILNKINNVSGNVEKSDV